MAFPLARADPVGERRHPVEHLVHVGDDITPVDDQRPLAWHAQRDVQHGAVLGDVDVLAREHGVAALGDAGLRGQLVEQAQALVGHPVLGVIEVQPGRLGRQPGAPLRVRGEEIAQVDAGDLAVVRGQRREGRELAGVGGRFNCHDTPLTRRR